MVAGILTEITDTTQARIEDMFDIARGAVKRQADQARARRVPFGEPALFQALPGARPGTMSARRKVTGCSSCS
jgi:hypothetical protein